MKLTKSYSVKIKNFNHIFDKTIKLYSDAVWFISDVIKSEYSSIENLSSKEKYNFIENQIHTTKDNKAKYDFDSLFINFPSYYRRSAIACALGKFESWYSNHKNWEINKQGKEPKFTTGYTIMPCFYKKNTYNKTDDIYVIRIKVFYNNSWDYIDVPLKKSDVNYIQKNCYSLKELSPSLQKKGKYYYIRFPFDCSTKVNNKKPNIICAVDLGINHVAVCSIMTKEGTVLKRKFISCNREEDSLGHYLNKIKKHQQMGSKENKTLWAKVNNFNQRISILATNEIINFAKENNVQVIVFEYLDTKGKKKGNRKQRLALWRKRDIQKRVELNAHCLGISVNRICAYNTSRLAFDGSGQVTRDKNNYSICTFSTGKIYNCDLSASYNIGARFFIKEIQKTISEKKWLRLLAKVPTASKRSTCTLSSLLQFNKLI